MRYDATVNTHNPGAFSHLAITSIPMTTSSNGSISALLAICAGNSPVTGEFPAQRPETRSFYFFFDLCLNKQLRKQSWGWWFEKLSRPLWRHCNVCQKRVLNPPIFHFSGAFFIKDVHLILTKQPWETNDGLNNLRSLLKYVMVFINPVCRCHFTHCHRVCCKLETL